MSGRVFISYKSKISADLAREIADQIGRISEMVAVKDVGFLSPSDRIETEIKRAIDSADLVLALIGSGWKIRSIKPTEDYVGFELSVAISSGKKVVQVLHGGGSVPKPDSLPTGLEQLSGKLLAESISKNESSHKADIDRLLVEVKRLAAGDKRRCLVVAARDQAELAKQIEESLRTAGMDMLNTYVARTPTANFNRMSIDARRCHALVAISSEGDSDGGADYLADPLAYACSAKSMIYPVITDRERTRFGGTCPGMQRHLDLRSSQIPPDAWITSIAEGSRYPT